MPHSLPNLLKFRLERLVLRGAHYRLLVIAALIGLISIWAARSSTISRRRPRAAFRPRSGGRSCACRTPATSATTGHAASASSPRADRARLRVFLGALVAIMTQWLNERMRELEAGLTPIAQRDHVLIIGWTTARDHRAELVMSSERVRRFLRLHGARTLRIAILADEVTTALSVELRDRLGSLWNERQVILRTGSPLRSSTCGASTSSTRRRSSCPAADFGRAGPTRRTRAPSRRCSA
jgi:ion channel POLLUX/CASTOR